MDQQAPQRPRVSVVRRAERSRNRNLQLRLQRPASKQREAASTETPITQGAYFPPTARGRITIGANKLRLAARRAPKASAVNYYMIDESSAPARVNVLEKMLAETV